MTFKTLAPAWVKAIREDAPAYGTARTPALERLGLAALIRYPKRATLVLQDGGERWYPGLPIAKVWRRRPPKCRACGQPIEHRAKVIVFAYDPSRYNHHEGRQFVIHEACPGRKS